MSDAHAERDDRLAQLLAEALDQYRSDGALEVTTWQGRHPELADELPALLDTLRDLHTAVEDWKAIAADATGPFAPPATVVLPKQIGRYRILGVIGEGGMGTVYRAEDPQLSRVVALKVPRIEGPQHYRDVAGKRFLREARAAAGVRHPYVCSIHDVGEHEGVPFVVMDYVAGRSLADRQAETPRFADVNVAVALARQVAEALAAVHAQGLVHRDLKPANILLDADGRAVLTDFGLARYLEDAEQLTVQGTLVGTPAYMAPEQASNTAGPVGPHTDIYSLGVVLYQMLTGRLPFEGSLPGLLYQINHDIPPTPSSLRPGLDPALEAVVQKAMARRPEERYATATDFGRTLENWAMGTTAVAPAPPPQAEEAAVPQRAPMVVRSELPDGGAVTVTVQSGELKPGKVTVSIKEQQGRKKRRRALAISVTVAFALLLIAVGIFMPLPPDQYAVHEPAMRTSYSSPPAAPLPLAMAPAQRDDAGRRAYGEKVVAELDQAFRPELAELDAAAYVENTRKLHASIAEAEKLQSQGKYSLAEKQYEQAVTLWQQVKGPDDPKTLELRGQLAQFYFRVGDGEKAVALQQETLKTLEDRRGQENLELADSMLRLADVETTLHRYDQAENLLKRSLAIRRTHLGENHPLVVQARENVERFGQVRAVTLSVNPVNSPDKMRVAWLQAFDKLVAQNVRDNTQMAPAALSPPNPKHLVLEAPGADTMQPRLLLKVWGVPVRDRQETDEKVNLAKYAWSPGERFYLYCETAVPVNVGLYIDETDNRARKILPDEMVPGSFDILKPGAPHRLGPLLEMRDNDRDETLELVVTLAGGQDDAAAARRFLTSMDGVALEGWQKKTRLRATCDPNLTARGDDGSKPSSPSVKDVAVLVASPETAGYVPLVLKKKK